jgi:hypothetical protein
VAIPPPTAPDKNRETRDFILKELSAGFQATPPKSISDVLKLVDTVLNKHLPSPVAAPGAAPIMSKAPATPVPAASPVAAK